MMNMTHTTRRPTSRTTHTPFAAGVIVLSAIAAIACGNPPEPGPVGDATVSNGTVTILNKTNELHTLTILPLGSNLSFDCQEVAKDPSALLSAELFNASEAQTFTVPLFSGEELAVDPAEWTNNFNAGSSNQCPAFLIQSNALPDIVVFYQSNFLNFKTYYHNLDLPERLDADQQTIVIDADYSQVPSSEVQHAWREYECVDEPDDNAWSWSPSVEWEQCTSLNNEELGEAARVPQGTRYSWRSMNRDIPLFFQDAVYDEGMPIRTPARCRVPGPGEGLAWEDVSFTGTRNLQTIEQGRDGCHTMRFKNEESWLFCAPFAPFAALTEPNNVGIRLAQEFDSSGVTLSVDNHPSIKTILLFRGEELDGFYDIRWEVEVRTGCAPIAETCGEVSLPADLRLTSFGDQLLVPGDVAELPVGELHLARVVYKPLINFSCEERDDFNISREPFVEGVLVTSF